MSGDLNLNLDQALTVRPLQMERDGEVLKLLALQMVSYLKEAELIGFSDIPPLSDTMQSLRESQETFIGCFDGEELVGATAFELDEEDTITISRMMVHPDRFRRGIGSKLLAHVLGLHSYLPCAKVTTGTANAPAMQLYERFGFVPHSLVEIVPGITLTEMIRHTPIG